MIKRILALGLALIASVAMAADTKISAYPSMSALGGTEIFLGNQSGSTKTATAAQVGTYVTANAAPLSFPASITSAAGATVGFGINSGALTPTYVDSTAAGGTINAEYLFALPAPNLETTTNTTYTNVYTLSVPAATCSAGGGGTPTCGTKVGILTAGINSIGGSNNITGGTNINVNTNSATSINSGTSNQAVTIGNGANKTSLGPYLNIGVKFTAAGTGTCSTVTTTLGGAQAGSFVCTGTSGAATVTITINGATGTTATNGWACTMNDLTTPTDLWHQTSSSNTTTAVFSAAALVQNDVNNFFCVGY